MTKLYGALFFQCRRKYVPSLPTPIPSGSSFSPSLSPPQKAMEDVFDGAVGIDLGTTYS